MKMQMKKTNWNGKTELKKLGEPRTSQAVEWDDQKEKEKTDELRNLISEVVKFSVKICSKIR
jgi:hypothetical protein